MIEKLNDQGFAPLTSPQIRDFGNRVLLSLAERHTDDISWKRVSTERLTENEAEARELHFQATWDSEIESYEYYVGISRRLPIDSEWSDEGVRNALNIIVESDVSSGNVDSDGGQTIDPNEESDHVFTDIEQPEGFLSMDHDYRFYVPYGHYKASATKSVILSIYDEDEEQVDAMIAYHHSSFVYDPVWQSEVENLVKFGEVALDAQRLEKSLSEVTVGDLEFILDSLKSYYLVRENCKSLSRRAW